MHSALDCSGAYADVVGTDEATIEALARRWEAEHLSANFWSDEITRTSVGRFIYLVEETAASGARLIATWGRSGLPEAGESALSAATTPLRAVALSLGGAAAAFNVVPELASQSRRAEWRALENYCERRPGTFLFVRVVWADEETGALEFGYSADNRSFVVARFDQFRRMPKQC